MVPAYAAVVKGQSTYSMGYETGGERFTVHQPRHRLVAGIILTLFFCITFAWVLSLTYDDIIKFFNSVEKKLDDVWPILLAPVIFLSSIITGIWMLLRAVVWRIQVDGNRIVYTSILGKKTEFTFMEITRVKPYKTDSSYAVNVYVGEKFIFAADQTSVNFDLLVSRLEDCIKRGYFQL